MTSRDSTWARLEQSPLDVLVIGGGIVGASVARDAAMRGMRTGLIEQADFASGTSGRSSRLLHGGLRYLAQGRLGLVREASLEKTVIHRIAPHLAAPLPFVFPTYRRNRNWKLWQLKIGVKIYDLLCGGRNLGKSTWLDARQVTEKIPGLNGDGLTGGVRYFDGFTNDARLVLDTLCSAARHGAAVINYSRLWQATRSDDDLWLCQVEDRESGFIPLQAHHVVNATGPWADGMPHSSVKLRLTKGVHLVIDQARLPVSETVVMTEGPRILFVIPWGKRAILGTTDTDYQGSPEEVQTDAGDITCLLDIANGFFPKARLVPADVISSWAGLRPLIADPKGRPSDISRSHEIHNPEPGWWDIAGGKLTTCRLMAEQAVDRILRAGNQRAASCRTKDEPLLSGLPDASFSGMIPPAFGRSAVEHFCQREWARHLDDVMIRRTSWHYYFAEAPRMAEQAAAWMAPLLGWDECRRRTELDRYLSSYYRTSPHATQRH